MTVLAAPRKSVVALVPTSRIWAIVCLALAIPMVAVTIALANDKTQTVVIIAGEAIAYAGIMLLALRRGIADPPEPIAVSRAELPPVMTIGRQVGVYGSLLAAGYAGLTYWGLAQHPQSVFSVGIALATPAITWFQYSRARRMEHDLRGELFVTQFGWRKKDRPAYVVRPGPAA
jgi:endonuclease/exonuclease/phosphatase (EEP) superfamily protein YafD